MAVSTDGKGLALLGVALGSIYLLTRPARSAILLSQFINPSAVADIAASLPQGEDDFILSAWDMVGNGIKYEGFSTQLKFTATTVLCEKCYLAKQVLAMGASNCVGKSVLLTSILRNRLPPERVYLVVGQLHLNGTGGHAWVTAQRSDGNWYLLEATLPPSPTNPWKTTTSLESVYSPEAMVNDSELVCMDAELCLTVKKANCDCHVAALRYLDNF